MSVREADNPELYAHIQQQNLLRQYDLLTNCMRSPSGLAMQLPIEKLEHRSERLDLIFTFREAVSLGREDAIGDFDAVLADGVDHRIGVLSSNSRIALALHHHQRLADIRGVEKRGDRLEHGTVGNRISDLGGQWLSLRLPIRRNRF